jgi:hypothetical protein
MLPAPAVPAAPLHSGGMSLTQLAFRARFTTRAIDVTPFQAADPGIMAGFLDSTANPLMSGTLTTPTAAARSLLQGYIIAAPGPHADLATAPVADLVAGMLQYVAAAPPATCVAHDLMTLLPPANAACQGTTVYIAMYLLLCAANGHDGTTALPLATTTRLAAVGAATRADKIASFLIQNMIPQANIRGGAAGAGGHDLRATNDDDDAAAPTSVTAQLAELRAMLETSRDAGTRTKSELAAGSIVTIVLEAIESTRDIDDDHLIPTYRSAMAKWRCADHKYDTALQKIQNEFKLGRGQYQAALVAIMTRCAILSWCNAAVALEERLTADQAMITTHEKRERIKEALRSKHGKVRADDDIDGKIADALAAAPRKHARDNDRDKGAPTKLQKEAPKPITNGPMNMLRKFVREARPNASGAEIFERAKEIRHRGGRVSRRRLQGHDPLPVPVFPVLGHSVPATHG